MPPPVVEGVHVDPVFAHAPREPLDLFFTFSTFSCGVSFSFPAEGWKRLQAFLRRLHRVRVGAVDPQPAFSPLLPSKSSR